jgi:hypothetical protein
MKMDLRFPALPALALGFCVTTADAAVILQQGFESTASDTWTYIASPDSYNTETTGNPLAVNGTNEDVWAVIEGFTNDIDTPANGDYFWGIQDIENTLANGLHSLDFNPIDLSNWTDVQLEFAYQAISFDAGDRLAYRLNGAESTLLNGASGGVSTNGWELVQLTLGSIDSLSLALLAEQDGGADYAGFDHVVLTGTPRITAEPRNRSTVPTPTSPALLLAGLGVLGWYWRVSRAAVRGDS